MLIGKQKDNFKVASITLVLAFMVIAEPVLAQDKRSDSGKSGGSSIKSEQVRNGSTGIRLQRPLDIIKPPASIAQVSASSRPQISSIVSRITDSSNFGRVTKFNISQPSSVVSTQRSAGITLGGTPASAPTPVFRQEDAGVSRGSRPMLRLESFFGAHRPSSSKVSTPHQLNPKQEPNSKQGWVSHNRTIGAGSKPFAITTQRSVTPSLPSAGISSDKIQRPNTLIGERRTSIDIIRKVTRDNELPADPRFQGDKPGQKTAQPVWDHTNSKRINLSVVDRLLPGSRPRKVVPDNQTTITNSDVISETDKVGEGPRSAGTHTHRHGLANFSPPHVTGHTYPQAVRNIHHHEHVYWDCYNRLCHRIVWPRYCFVVRYGYGPYFTFRYVYPYHFRRYIFVSLAGYWPIDYRCIRYYWYGCHPYMWYGYYPIAYEVPGNTYNYYTYNYYYDDDNIVASESGQVVDGIRPVDHNTFADVREKLAQQKAEEPEPETLADTYFDEGVKAFEAGDYNIAIEKFAAASELAPDDMVVPFAYSQALFATEQYCQAAEVLRAALAKVCPEKEGVFYPRGLYSSDDILFEQIEHLTKKAELFSFDADLQLLLGYQWLGIGEVDKAVEPLQRASQDFENAAAATILLDLLAKIKTNNETEKNSD